MKFTAKNIRIAGLALAVTMGLGVTAFAAENVTKDQLKEPGIQSVSRPTNGEKNDQGDLILTPDAAGTAGEGTDSELALAEGTDTGAAEGGAYAVDGQEK